MFGWIKNLGLSWKVQLGPGFLVVALVGLGIYFLQTLQTNQQSAADLISGPMRRSELANDLTASLWTAHANMYRLAATAASEKDDQKIQRFAKDASASAAKVAEAMDALEASGGVKPDVLGKLKAKVLGYVKQSKTAIEMTDDSGTGLQFIMGAERQFKQVEQLTDDLITDSVDGRNLEIARSQMRLEQQQLTLEIVLAIVAILGVMFSFIVGRGISRPVVAMSAAMRRLAVGDFSVQLPGLDRGDEVGQMARAVEEFKIQAVAKAERELAERESKARELAQARKTELHDLAQRFEAAVGDIIEHVNSASSDLENSAIVLTRSSVATQDLSAVVATASEETSSNVQSVASATEEMAASVNEIGRQVHDSNKIASEAVAQAERTDARMAQLSLAASRIGDVTMLISTIAGQTNLLALNATIEAARAGEAGRGFAIVAQEVKALAAQTTNATHEISEQIAAMQAATEESVSAIKEISGTIAQVSEIASAIAASVEEQGAATREIALNVQQAAVGTTRVATSIADVHRGAGETGSASSQVLSAAQMLSNENKRLKTEVARFLDTVRAA
ncbi:MAG: HAMP domain-containing protein [Xanthobacteraceae bacterium]|nr:HAMP domain-containing protein [Xanthobacteraceae bacterium]